MPVGERTLTGIAPVVAAAKSGDPVPSRPETPLATGPGGSAPIVVVIGESRVKLKE
jgi:hypothetical protein